ncbi:MAG: oligoendopeptidase F family protein, partial [Clostridiales bacterium]|nr:oligoendopeptidase F family protein [Clostridiales bacterium]
MSQVKRLPKRNEIPDELKWKLEDIYPSQEEWEKDYQWVKEALPKTEEVKGTLGRSAQDLLKGLDFDTQLSGKIEKLYSYAHMKKDEDNGNTEAQALLDRAQALYVEYSSAVSFYIPEILAIPEEKLEEFLSAEEGLE